MIAQQQKLWILYYTYSLQLSSFQITTLLPVWSFWLESKLLWQLMLFLFLQQCF